MLHEADIERLVRDIKNASRIVALSGAGMSVESGIASFRGPGGLWEKYDPEEYGHINTLRYEPAKAWIMLSEMQREILKAKPNKGHYALAELEKMGKLRAIITQNVDGLHHVAGNRDVIEFHGHLQSVSCMDCGYQVSTGCCPNPTKAERICDRVTLTQYSVKEKPYHDGQRARPAAESVLYQLQYRPASS
jgi:NAD-dependent deacetylase